MIPKTIPITQVKPDLKDAVRMAVAEIERFLCLFHAPELVRSKESALAIAGLWLSRIKGFHEDEDFVHLVRDFLAYVMSGGERSRISDQLGWYFGGFMPSYGSTRILMDMAVEGQSWTQLQAFMHSQSYGAARRYVEEFDWKAAQKKAQAEIKAWSDILQEQDATLRNAAWGEPVVLAQAQPALPPRISPANDPYMPKPRPDLRAIPGGGAAAEGVATEGLGTRLLGMLRFASGPLQVLVLALTPTTMGDGTLKGMQQQPNVLHIPLEQTQSSAQVDTTNNDCRPQTETNKKNGAECENDGYVLMEQALQYKRLINPPKGKGLDGLFEKLSPLEQPNPMPVTVTAPKPGKLVFIPEDKKPPRLDYDYVGEPKKITYPKFLVFEAKHVAKQFEEKDLEGIKKEGKNRLGNTCDGLQMSEPWTERRIPQALEKNYPGKANSVNLEIKVKEIFDEDYARWIFICLPGSVGNNSKIFVFIDVIESGLGLENTPPKKRKGRKNPSSNNSDL